MQFVEKFDLLLTPDQQEALDRWIEVCRRVWNIGLGLLLEWENSTVLTKEPVDWISKFEDSTHKVKVKTIAVPRSPFAVKGDDSLLSRPVKTAMFLNQIPLGDDEEDDENTEEKGGKRFRKVWGEHCWILPKNRVGGTVDKFTGQTTHAIAPNLIRVGQCCPLPIPEWKEPRLGLEPVSKYTLQYFFTQKNMKELYPEFAPDFCELPVWFIRGVCKALTEAWTKYRSGKAGVPKFKRFGEATGSMSHHDGKVFHVEPILKDEKETPDGIINIPKFGEIAATELWQRWGENPIAVLQLVKTFEKNDEIWQIHLTGYKIHPSDIYNVARLVMAQKVCNILSPFAQFELLTLSPWSLKRRAKTKLTVPGKGYVVATDDRGTEYSVLPRRPSDGAIDPHNKIAELDRKILALQQTISRQEKNLSISNRLRTNRRKLAALKRKRTQILNRNRKKIAHFISERSAKIEITQAKVQRIKKPKRKLKAGSIDPAVYEANAASKVAEINRSKADVAPGEFILLIKNEAKERSQVVTIIKEK